MTAPDPVADVDAAADPTLAGPTAGGPTADGPVVVDIRCASFGYTDQPVVQDVDLRIRTGEVVALLGPNGSGKTTVIRGLLGLARTMGGEVELFGRSADQLSQRWRIGYVPQRHTVVGAIPSTVAEVVGSGRLARRRLWSWAGAADRSAITEAIERMGLGHLRDAPVGDLSGGQQRRVLIARALAAQPDVLIMDEPTAGVDAESSRRLVATLAGLLRHELTMLVVTHEISTLRPILTRAVQLRDGRVVADAPIAQADRLVGQDEVGHDDAGDDLQHTTAGPKGLPADPLRQRSPSWLGDPGLGG